FGRLAGELAIAVAAHDLDDADRRQVARADQAAAPALDLPVFGKLAENGVQRRAVAALDAERIGDVAPAGLAGMRDDIGENLVAGGERALLRLGRFAGFLGHLSPVWRRRASPCRRFSLLSPSASRPSASPRPSAL